MRVRRMVEFDSQVIVAVGSDIRHVVTSQKV